VNVRLRFGPFRKYSAWTKASTSLALIWLCYSCNTSIVTSTFSQTSTYFSHFPDLRFFVIFFSLLPNYLIPSCLLAPNLLLRSPPPPLPKKPKISASSPLSLVRTSSSPRSIETILAENPGRFVLFPIQDDVAWTLYKIAQASIWTAEEIDDLSVDRSHYQELSLDETHFLKHILAFFTTADGVVNENLLLNLSLSPYSRLRPAASKAFRLPSTSRTFMWRPTLRLS
jgi:hypothetical protein